MDAHGALSYFESIVASSDTELNLAEAAFAIALDEYPDLDVAAELTHLDELAADLAKRLPQEIATPDLVNALSRYLFDELAIRGNESDYYNPRNSFLNDVLTLKRGIPITLCVLFIEMGRRVGLGVEAVAFPGHFLVKVPLRRGELVVDPFRGGMILSNDELAKLLKRVIGMNVPGEAFLARFLAPCDKKQVLVRMLRNLKAIYVQQNEPHKALNIVHRILTLYPDAPIEYRDRAVLYQGLDCFRAALSDYQQYLVLEPAAPDGAEVTAAIEALQAKASRLN